MIKHIVMWNIKDGVEGKSKKENISQVKKELEKLPDLVDQIVKLEVGINLVEGNGQRDLILSVDFKNLEDLEIYQKHPEHIKVGKSIAPYLENRAFVDYEI